MAASVTINGPSHSVTVESSVDEVSVPAVGPTVYPVADEQPVTVQPFKGLPGDDGPPGPPGTTEAVTYIRDASVPLSGHRALVLNDDNEFEYADPTTVGNQPVFVSLNAASTGDPVTAVSEGFVIEATWNWSPGNVYLGTNGVLTQTAPSSGLLVVVGESTASDTMYVDRQPTIEL